MTMTNAAAGLPPETVARMFTRADGSYAFARWGRPIVPVVFGVDDATLSVVKGAIEAVVALAGHKMAETDPEIGANVMIFFLRDWDELLSVPDLGRMIDGLDVLVARLKARGANQYRTFRFDAGGAIKACFGFCRLDAALAALPADTVALSMAVQTMLSWSDGAFAEVAPLAEAKSRAVLRPEIAALLQAAYAPTMPAVARDPSHALRLAARIALATARTEEDE